MRAVRLFLSGLAVVAVLAGAERGNARDNNGAPTPVTLQLRWVPQFQFAGYYLAIDNGHYRDAGLDVTIVPGGPGRATAVDAVLGGDAHFGISGSGLIRARADGKPVVVLAAIFQHSPNVWLSRRDSNIVTLHDLVGKRLMTFLPWTESIELIAPFAAEGIPLDKLTLVPTTYDIDALATREVDAYDAYITNEPYALEQRGIPYRLIRPQTYGVDFYGDVLFTSDRMIRDQPDTVARFRAASLAGWRDAMADIAATARAIKQRHAPEKSLDHLIFEGRQMSRLVRAEIVDVGYMNPGRWRRIGAVYQSQGLIDPDASIDLEGFLYDPNPPRLPSWAVPAMFIAMAVTLVCAGVALLFARLNRRLRLEIAERHAAEAALAARTRDLESSNSQKDLILGVVGHDVRNLFNAIIGPADLLAISGATMATEQLSYLSDQIRTAGTNALGVLENILQWVSLEIGATTPKLEKIDIARLTSMVAGLYGGDAKRKGIQLDVDAPPLTHAADRRALSTILRNLIYNAIKYTNPGGSVSVSAARRGTGVVLTVTDTGVGMAPEAAATLFESGMRRESTLGTNGEIGTGLGIGLCREMANTMGARIAATSAPNQGTTVTVTLGSDEEPDMESGER